MAWVGDHLFSFAQWLVVGLHDQLPRIGRHGDDRPARDRADLLLRAAARVREPADAGDDPHGGRGRASSAGCSRYFTAVARRCGAEILDGKPVALLDRIALRARQPARLRRRCATCSACARIRVAYTAGAAIGPDLFRFYRSIGINLKQLYGSTETCAYVCLQPDGGVQFDTVGEAAPGVELKIADNGEVLVRGPMLLKEYYKRPDATAEVDRRRRLLPHRRRRLLRRRRAAEDHRPREGRRQARDRRDVRAQLHREQAQVLPAHQGSGRVRRRAATACARSSTSTWARSATGPSGAASRIPATPISPRKPEVYELIRELRRAGERRARAASPGSPTRRSTAS